MTVQQEISAYLDECGVFFFGTVDNGAPVIRPIGFQLCKDGQMYFGIGTFKNVYAQIVANPSVYICAIKPDNSGWIRVSGTAVFDDDPALLDAAWECMPNMKPVYESNGWEMGMFHLENAKATWVKGFMQPVRTEEF